MIMKSQIKRAMVFVCAAALLASCGGGNKKAAGNEKMTIKWLGMPNFAGSSEGTYAEKYIEDKFNVEIEPVFIDSTAYTQKLPIQMSSGDIPDLVYLLDPQDVQNYASQDYIMEIPYEKINEKAPTVFADINEKLPELWTYSRVGDKNYGIPNFNTDGARHNLGLWRSDWLKNVGIDKIPETLDEFHDAYYKFTYNDPDGNGQKDTYGCSAQLQQYFYFFNEIFGAYGVTPFNWMEKDGKVVYGMTLPETKQALELLRGWYSEGIIDPDFITDSTDTIVNEKFNKGKIGYYNMKGGDVYCLNEKDPNTAISKIKSGNPNAELAIAMPPKNSDGHRGTHAWGDGGHIIAFGRQLNDEPEKLDKILEIIEAINTDDELSMALRMGEKDVTYEDDAEGLSGYKYKFKEGVSPWDEALRLPPRPSFFGVIAATDELYDSVKSDFCKEWEKKYYSENYGMVDALMKPDILPSAGEYYQDLVSKQLTAFGSIIRGDKDISYLDEFIETWRAAGGNKLEEEANEYKNNTMKKVLDETSSIK